MRVRRIATAAALVALLGTVAAPAGAAEGPRGTGSALISGVSISALDGTGDNAVNLASTDLVRLDSLATRDADRVDEASIDLAEGTLSFTEVSLDDLPKKSIPDPVTVRRSAENPGSDPYGPGAIGITVPGGVDFPDDSGFDDVTITAPEINADRAGMIDFINGLAGSDGTSIAEGDVLSATIEPLDLLAVFDPERAAFNGGVRVADASALGGLVDLAGFGVAEQEAWSEVDLAGGAIRGASLDRLVVLDLEAFLHLLGLSFDDLPLSVLVALADQLGEDVTAVANELGITADSWEGLFDELDETRDELEAAIEAGEETCESLTDTTGDLLEEADIVCDSLEAALDDVTDLLDDLRAAVENVLAGAALLSVEDVAGEVQAVAQVDATGTANTSATATGRVGAVKVGDVTVGSIEADLSKDSVSAIESKVRELAGGVHQKLDAVLGVLGETYTGLIDVLPIAVLEQNTGVEGQYAVAEARLSLLQVRVSLPEVLDEVTGLADGDDGSDGGSTDDGTGDDGDLLDEGDDLLDEGDDLLSMGDALPISNVRPAGVLGQVEPLGQTLTVDVGVLSASAEHTRPGVQITDGGENRTFDSSTGFGDGPIPRTGAESGVILLVAAVLVTAGWFGRRALARAEQLA